MIFTQSVIANSVCAANQYENVRQQRQMANLQEKLFASLGQQLTPNAGLIPQDVYQDFDRVTVERMRLDDGDAFLNDLMPLAKSINIGKLVHKFNRASDAGVVQTSMSGQTDVKMDNVDYNTDGCIVPITDAGYGRNWREWEGQRSEGFDSLIDDQRETVATMRESLADQFLDGHKDKNGKVIVVDALSWSGIRNDSRVASVDLGAGGINFDFTDTTKTFTEIEAAFKQVRNVLWLTEKCSKDATYYVSNEIASNFERASSENFDSQKILQRLAGLQFVKELKATNKMSGNELMAFPLDGTVQPVTGMGMSTIAMPRPMYNSNYNFVVVAGVGFKVKTDFDNNTCALYATG